MSIRSSRSDQPRPRCSWSARFGLRDPDLRRLLRLHRHRARRRTADRLRALGQLPLARTAAISPSDFWRRWHISLSSLDHRLPLHSARRLEGARALARAGRSGRDHGARRPLARSRRGTSWRGVSSTLCSCSPIAVSASGAGWRPAGRLLHAAAWCAMFSATLFGWILFRAPSLRLARARRRRRSARQRQATRWSRPRSSSRWSWCGACRSSSSAGVDDVGAARPLASAAARRRRARRSWSLFARENAQDFIYFQF